MESFESDLINNNLLITYFCHTIRHQIPVDIRIQIHL